MNLRPVIIAVVLLGSLAAFPAWAVRDPFWPVGYEPPKAAVVEAAPLSEPVIQVTEIPITEAEWAKARKALVISGFTQSTRPDNGAILTQVMINRRTYAAGDTLSVTNLDIQFIWRVESVANHDLKLTPLEATRVKNKPASVKKERK